MSQKQEPEIKLALEGKDRDFFQSRGIPFPLYWYGYKDLPQNKKKSRAYSTEMRELSDMSMEELIVIEMFWGMSPLVIADIHKVDPEFVEHIPVPTPTRINALIQVRLSMLNSDERKEWADRVEGKPVSREVSMSLNTMEDENSTKSTKEFIKSKFDELGELWAGYGDMASKELPHQEVKLIGQLEDNGEAER